MIAKLEVGSRIRLLNPAYWSNETYIGPVLVAANLNYPYPPDEGLIQAYREDKPNMPEYMLKPGARGIERETIA